MPALFALGASVVLLGLADTPWLRLLVSIWLLKSTFAVSALGAAATEVRRALAPRRPAGGPRRRWAACAAGTPRSWTPPAVAAGAVESVAENTADSVVAPLLFFVVFGLPGAIFYRAVNTLDARIGYHGRYEFLGKASARLDDLLNWVPARLAAGLLLVAGAWHKLDARRGWQVMVRDGGRTESPNAGRPMAAMAGPAGRAPGEAGALRAGGRHRRRWVPRPSPPPGGWRAGRPAGLRRRGPGGPGGGLSCALSSVEVLLAEHHDAVGLQQGRGDARPGADGPAEEPSAMRWLPQEGLPSLSTASRIPSRSADGQGGLGPAPVAGRDVGAVSSQHRRRRRSRRRAVAAAKLGPRPGDAEAALHLGQKGTTRPAASQASSAGAGRSWPARRTGRVCRAGRRSPGSCPRDRRRGDPSSAGTLG